MRAPFFISMIMLCLISMSACTTETEEKTDPTAQVTEAVEQAADTLPKAEDIVNETSSVDWTKMSLGEIESASEILTAVEFCTYLADSEFDAALELMDADATTKQAWKTNFSTLEKLKIESVGPVRIAEWTDSRQIFKVHLTATVSPEGEELGWMNGENERWISLQKNGDRWQVHEFAYNP
ncbi:MAG TPA: hypothetical protein PKL83_04700 [bacterium]|nr:hypothetical protein [bacterium]